MTVRYASKLFYLSISEKARAVKWFLTSSKESFTIRVHKNVSIKLSRYGLLARQLFEQQPLIRHRLSFEYAVIEKIRESIRPGFKILDIGANIGVMSLIMAKEMNGAEGSIYAFEPSAETYVALVKNVQLNGFQNKIKPQKIALSDKSNAESYMVAPNKNGADAYKYILPEGQEDSNLEKISSMTLDEWFSSAKIDKIDLIKMDIEGGEMLVLKGAAKFFETNRPVIIFECVSSSLARYGYFINDVFKYLDQYNYKISSIDESNWIATQKN